MEVTPLEISTSPEVSRTDRISIRMSLASASAVVERGSLITLVSGSSLGDISPKVLIFSE
ncbi:MAG: hypothetical protein ACFFCZ_05565 [Promethearchaeota archaeon]